MTEPADSVAKRETRTAPKKRFTKSSNLQAHRGSEASGAEPHKKTGQGHSTPEAPSFTV